MSPRKALPITQRHADGCPGRNCLCPWSFRVRLPDGTQPRVTRDSYEDAEREYHELKSRRPGPLADRTTTIAQWARRWQAGASHWRQGTRKGMEIAVRVHINPYLGHIPVTELTRDQVRLWVTEMREKGVGTPTMGKAVETLRTMYNVWLEDGRLLPGGVPIPRGLVKRPARKQFTPLTTAQVQAWAAAMPPEMALVVGVQAYCGGRESEILGLREQDITWIGKDVSAPLAAQLAHLAALSSGQYDARKPKVGFERQLDRDTRAGGETKNARANRTLPLPQWLAARLAAQLAQWPPVDGWLFANRRPPGGRGVRRPAGIRSGFSYIADGKPYRADGYNEWLRKAARDAGIVLPPNQCSHALRHHCVSVLRAKGWSDHDIGAWIGDTAQTVAHVYGRPMPDALDRIAEMLSAEWEDPGPPLRAV